MTGGGMEPVLADSDRAMFEDRTWMTAAMAGFRAMFTFGLEGYADDRIADGRGWCDFDLSAITCPVIVLHGALDKMTDPMHAHHTAESPEPSWCWSTTWATSASSTASSPS
jgi:pimeloyl-ACP methyl ester carboxylesterase